MSEGPHGKKTCGYYFSGSLEPSEFECPPQRLAIHPLVHSRHSGRSRAARHQDYPYGSAKGIAELGFGGVVANVSYGPGYPDDPDVWDRFREVVKEYEDAGLDIWIYDEQGYPSGTAGGAVLEAKPELEARGLVVYHYWRVLQGPMSFRADALSGKLYKALLVPVDDTDDPIDITDTANERGTLRFSVPEGKYTLLILVERELYEGTHAAHSYSDPRRYINLLDERATDEFMRITHEKYAACVGESFGKSVKAFFTDEPSLMSWNIENLPYPIISWRSDFPDKFRKHYGYGIELALVAVLLNRGAEVIKRRCDFWEFVASELADNFFGKIQDWCRAHNVMASGHLLAEEDLISHLFLYGSYYISMRRFDAPGIDQLCSEPEGLMSRRSIPIARLAASIADVFGRSTVMSEASDHTSREAGRQIPMDWIRASMNWHYALGVNLITSYFGFGRFAPSELRDLNRYVARLGYMLRRGSRFSRVAVLYPEHSLWAACTPVRDARGGVQSKEAQRIASVFRGVSWALLDEQIDFDYVDERVLLDSAVEDGKLVFDPAPESEGVCNAGVGARAKREYETVILPSTTVLSSATAKKLAQFMDEGGKVIAVGALPSVAREGEADCRVEEIFSSRLQRGGSSLIYLNTDCGQRAYECINALPRTIRLESTGLESACTCDATAGGKSCEKHRESSRILSHVRRDGDVLIVFLCNMEEHEYKGTLCVDMPRIASCEVWNPLDGSVRQCEITNVTSGGVSLEVSIPAYGGVFVVAKQQ